jgi:hypothetical protein
MTEVQEVDVDVSDALRSTNEVYEEQKSDPKFSKVALASEEDVAISEKNLAADLKARRELEAKKLAERAEQIQSAPEGPTQADIGGIDQLQEREEEKKEVPEKSPQEILEQLGLKEQPVGRSIIDSQGNTREYIQKPLSFLGKIQFLSYIGEVLDKAMSGQNALQLNSLFEVPAYRADTFSAQDFSDAQTFVQAVGKIMVYAPDFLTKSYAIWLRVPEYEREWFAEAIEESLSDEVGEDIIETFIDQNWGTLQSFFSERLPKIRDRLSARYRVSQSEQSKR